MDIGSSEVEVVTVLALASMDMRIVARVVMVVVSPILEQPGTCEVDR
jgi:hypothetical protein